MVVYAMGALGTGLVKIGFTTGNPRTRMHDLQIGCPHKLLLLGTWEGGEREEAAIHSVLGSSNVRGEWFDFAAIDWVEYAATHNDLFPTDEICKGFDDFALTQFCLGFPHSLNSRALMIVLWQTIGINDTAKCFIDKAKNGLQETQRQVLVSQATLERMMQGGE